MEIPENLSIGNLKEYISTNIVFLVSKYILINLLLLGFFLLSCKENPNEPIDDLTKNNYLFIEMGVYSTGSPKGDTIILISRYPTTYYFNDQSREIEVDLRIQKYPIRKEDKCIIGSYTLLGPGLGDGEVGTLKTINSFPHLDTIWNPPLTKEEEILIYKINSDGSVEINFNQQTFTLPINSLYQCIRKRINIEIVYNNFKQKYDSIQHLYSIRNWGYINKNNVIIK